MTFSDALYAALAAAPDNGEQEHVQALIDMYCPTSEPPSPPASMTLGDALRSAKDAAPNPATAAHMQSVFDAYCSVPA